MSDAAATIPPVARILGAGAVPIWSMTSAERLRRSLARAGVTEVEPSAPGAAPSAGRAAVILRADRVYDPGLVAALVASPGALLLMPAGGPEAGAPVAAHVPAEQADAVADALARGAAADDPAFDGLRAGDPAAIGSAHNSMLRKRETPYLIPLRADTVRAAEWRTFQGAYKGVTDFVTKHLWPVPAFHVTRFCAALKLTPNMVTWVGVALVFAAMWLFSQGQFGLGLAAAWGMTFLDTVDGKLARVTMQSSKWGNILDHGTDLVHPPFWYYAWIVGLDAVGMPVPMPWWVLAVVLGGYVAQRIEEGIFIALFKIQMHVWRPFDSAFRQITARRNPNLAILTVFTLFGRPDWGIVVVAVWTGLCFLVHGAQILQAMASRKPVVSWLAAGRPGPAAG